MKIGYLTWIYKGAEKYFDEYTESLNNQTLRNVDLYYINNGLEYKYYKNLRKKLNFKSVTHINCKGNLFKKIIETLDVLYKGGYDLVIFGDIDDTFSCNRFESFVEVFNSDYDILYNNLYTFDKKHDFFKGTLPETINSIDTIIDGNCLGMSYTGINIKRLGDLISTISIPNDIIAFDWYFYTILLSNNKRALRIRKSYTYYRIYDNNLAGNNLVFDKKKFFTGCKVKIGHYKNIVDLNDKIYRKIEDVKKLYITCLNNDIITESYIETINKSYTDKYFWWEKIINLDILEEKNEIK